MSHLFFDNEGTSCRHAKVVFPGAPYNDELASEEGAQWGVPRSIVHGCQTVIAAERFLVARFLIPSMLYRLLDAFANCASVGAYFLLRGVLVNRGG